MRIAHVITRLILGGAQENTLLTCEGLLRDFHDDVLLITGPAIGPEGSLIKRAKEHNVPLCEIPDLRRAIHPWRDYSAYRKLRKVLKEYRPDVVHTHSAKGGILGRAAAWSMQIPLVVHGVHGAPFHPYQSRTAREFFRRCERWGAKRCHAFISVADAMTDLMVHANVAPREMFTTIYSGMEVEPFLNSHELRQNVRAELGYSAEHIVIGKVARLFHLKGHQDILSIARQLLENEPRVRFLFVGDGILRSTLEAEIERQGLQHAVKFTGLVPPEQIPGLIAAMDVVVHTSLREGLARVLPQALLSGKPAVSYDIDGAREVVISGETGWLVPPRDTPALLQALKSLAEDESLRIRLGAEGRRRFAEQFDAKFMVRQIRDLYVRGLAKSSRRVNG